MQNQKSNSTKTLQPQSQNSSDRTSKQISEVNKYNFDIQVLLRKISKTQYLFTNEEDALKERLQMRDLKYDTHKYADMQNQLDEDIDEVINLFRQRVQCVKAEIQTRNIINKVSTAQSQLPQIQADPQVVSAVNSLKRENAALTQEVAKQIQLKQENEAKYQKLGAELNALLNKQHQHQTHLFDIMKQKAKGSLKKYHDRHKNDIIQMIKNDTGSQQVQETLQKPSKVKAPISTGNNEYDRLHAKCAKDKAEIKKQYQKMLDYCTSFQSKINELRSTIQRLMLKYNVQKTQDSFLEYYATNETLGQRFINDLNDSQMIEIIIQLCMIEDVSYNVHFEGNIQQRVGLSAQSQGLRRRFNVVYDV